MREGSIDSAGGSGKHQWLAFSASQSNAKTGIDTAVESQRGDTACLLNYASIRIGSLFLIFPSFCHERFVRETRETLGNRILPGEHHFRRQMGGCMVQSKAFAPGRVSTPHRRRTASITGIGRVPASDGRFMIWSDLPSAARSMMLLPPPSRLTAFQQPSSFISVANSTSAIPSL